MNYLALAPELTVLTTGLLVLVVELFISEKNKRYLGFLSIAGLWLAAVFAVRLIGTQASLLGDMFAVDSFALVLKTVMLIASSLAVLLALDFLNYPNSKQGEYYCLLLFSTLGMSIVASASNLIAVFVGIQLASVPLYILAGFERFDLKSNEAALKYFLLGVLTAGVTLYGLSLVYGLTGTLNLSEIATRLLKLSPNDPVLFIGMTFVVSGLTFKIAAVPFHFWAPDTYEGAPTPVTAFIAAVPKVAGFAALIRLIFTAFPEFSAQWVGLFGLGAILTMLTGNILAIPQKNIKRMLAFSGIAHVGYILIGLAVTNEHALAGMLFYLVAYSAMNLGAFAVVIALGRSSPESQIEDYAGLSQRAPLLAGAMAVFMISLVGFPTTAGFVGKLLIFGAAIEKGYVWLAIAGVINSVISLYYYLNVIRHMYFMPPKVSKPVVVPAAIWAVIGVAVVLVFGLGLAFEPLIELTRSVTLLHVRF